MSTLNHIFDLQQEQICYVQCGFCTTILLVSVPCSSLSMVVTVRCGHCSGLLSVNMSKASFFPLHLLSPVDHHHHEEPKEEEKKTLDQFKSSSSMVTTSDNEDEDSIQINQIVNKPPEKRQRAPSAYNCFIKEEIRRLKSQNPNMAHKEAFSTAAKNWAHCPPMEHKGKEKCCGQLEEQITPWNYDSNQVDEINEEDNRTRERKASRNSIQSRTPFA